MGKKYIIELEDKPFHKEDGDFLYRVKGFNSLVFDMTGVGKLTPYTEPDLERVKKTAHDDGYSEGYQAGRGDLNQVLSDVESDVEQIRKEAYQKGYETGYEDGYNEPGKNQQEAYQRGLSDAWEAARTLWNTPNRKEIFGHTAFLTALTTLTAQETIEKIRQYEQEQEEFHVGDEVELKCGVRPAIYMQGTKGSDEIYLLFNDGSCGVHSKSEIVRKTGRHFPEIVTILENMRGEQDG